MKNKVFVSADPFLAQVREELSSYITSGAIDDLLWPKYVSDCLKTIRKSGLPVKQCAVTIQNNQGSLPSDFGSVKEIWACGNITYEYTNPSSYYYQRDCRLDNITDPCHVCNQEATCDKCDPCKKQYMVVHKVTGTHQFSYNYSHPLKPGNLQARNSCSSESPNLYVNSPDTFDISGCDLITSYKEGVVHLIYYSNGMDENDEQLIPDNFWFQEYVMKYIKYKVFQKLYNTDGGETFNQSRVKFQEAEQAMIEAKITAETELKRENKYRAEKRMQKTENRYNSYYRMLNMGR